MKSLKNLLHSTRGPSSYSVSTPTSHRRVTVLGFVYVLLTAAGTVVYVDILTPSVANDHWWPHFNTTGAQTFLGDLYNAKLATGTKTLDLFSSVVVKDYSQRLTSLDLRQGTARSILLSRLPLDQAISLIRSETFVDNMRTFPPPCWLDFSRMYEMAHTASHQVLCNQRRQANAAFYMATLLRNLQQSDLAASTYYPEVERVIFAPLQTTDHGAQVVQSILARPWLSVADETSLWTSNGLAYFQNIVQNYYEEGMQDTIVIENAMGMRQTITIYRKPHVTRPKSYWTTVNAYCGMWNDLDSCAQSDASLIRSAPNNFEALGNNWDYYYSGTIGTNATEIIRANLGPLTVIDIFLVPPPSSLLALVSNFKDTLYASSLQSLSGLSAYVELSEPVVDAVPAAWVSPHATYYGGNPMCAYGTAMPFVQLSFSYDDDCGTQDQLVTRLAKDSVLFAMMATSVQSQTSFSSICGLCSSVSYASCLHTLASAYTVFHDLVGPSLPSFANALQETNQDLLPLNTSFVQWATLHGVDQVLTQRMVSPSDPWSFFGWMAMFDWANDGRQVFSFEGDYATYVLMSRPVSAVPLVADDQELPHSACVYLLVICIYVSAVLVVVLTLVLVYGTLARFNVDGRNLFVVNRLIGSTYVGRPFLFLRGFTAIIVLSTSPVTLTSYSGMTKLDFAPRPLWHILVIAGEASWITYVVNDFLVPLTSTYSAHYAPVSSILTWLILVVVEGSIPYRATASIDRKCSILSFIKGVNWCKHYWSLL
ncbi:Aste57867_10058 [Aphanomyces stellatus]|uniref:Aste57867_10058 protein n=1 Tax=Aphanomyces stellatus TaxID=120398 RepID=A0A485KQ38_9STRA|nr:hypothetical protein As57867_010019 [Aphanomyces stellatus]VFT86934.1 Aste57867_10058 [Aphanomyces stellatus]